MNPNSPQSEFNSLIEKAIGITDSTYQSIMLKEINQVRLSRDLGKTMDQ